MVLLGGPNLNPNQKLVVVIVVILVLLAPHQTQQKELHPLGGPGICRPLALVHAGASQD